MGVEHVSGIAGNGGRVGRTIEKNQRRFQHRSSGTSLERYRDYYTRNIILDRCRESIRSCNRSNLVDDQPTSRYDTKISVEESFEIAPLTPHREHRILVLVPSHFDREIPCIFSILLHSSLTFSPSRRFKVRTEKRFRKRIFIENNLSKRSSRDQMPWIHRSLSRKWASVLSNSRFLWGLDFKHQLLL